MAASTESLLDRLESSYREDGELSVDAMHIRDQKKDSTSRVDWKKDELSCIVNPHFLRCVADMVYKDNSGQCSLETIFDMLASSRYSLGMLRRSTAHDLSIEPLASSVVVNVALCESIRPGHISLPPTMRKIFALADFETVHLELLDRLSHGPSILQSISLRPVFWYAQGESLVPSALTTLRSHPSAVDAVRSALMLLRDNATCNPFIFCHGSVINLPHAQSRLDYAIELQQPSSSAVPSFICIAQDDDNFFLECLEAVSILEDFRAFLPAKLLQSLSASTLDEEGEEIEQHSPRDAHLLGFEKGISTLIIEGMPCVSTLAVFNRIRLNLRPMNRLIVHGAFGSGKTALCKEVGRLLKNCPRTLCHFEYLDCRILVGQTMASVTGALNSAFTAARRCGPTVLVLDNLDAICPAMEENAGPYMQQVVMITLHVQTLMDGVLEEMEKSHDIACATYEDCLQKGAIASDRHMLDLVVWRALLGAVYVIGTAKSCADLNYRLRRPRFFCKAVSVPALCPAAGLSILGAALKQLHVSFADGCLSGNFGINNDLTSAVEGFRPKDLDMLARRVSAIVAQRVAADSLSKSDNDRVMQTHYEDIVQGLQDFVPISGRTNQPAATARGVSWKSVGGYQREKADLLDIFQKPIIFRPLFQQSVVRMPRAALLYGPPGCGKTLFAQAAGAELGLAFMAVQGPQLLDKYIGASEKAVRNLFERAANNGRPTLVFFDEFEALAPKRGRENTGVTDRVVNQLLTFLDGVEATMGGKNGANQVYVLAATSRPDLIDVALLRPGRLEKHIYLGLPSREDRVKILEAALGNLSVSADLSAAVTKIANHTLAASFTAADLDALAKTAYLAAAQDEIEDLWSATREDNFSQSGVLIQGKHLLQAFETSRPSLSSMDLEFYSDLYTRFSGNRDFPFSNADASQDGPQRLILK